MTVPLITSRSDPEFRISEPPGTVPPPRFGLSVRERLSLEVVIGTAGPPGADTGSPTTIDGGNF